MKITRRDFAFGASALALSVALGSLANVALVAPASAQQLLMQAGPLGDMAQGDEKAPVTIIEYASMTCPHCADFHATTYPELKKRYIDTGKVRFIFREFPLDQLALAGFLLARCVGPDKYFPMIDTLFQLQKEWVVQKPLGPLLAIAKQAGMSEQQFNECLQDKKLIDGHRGGAAAGDEAQRPVHALVLHQRQAVPRRLQDRGIREGDGPLSQGLTRVFCDFHRPRAAPARRPPAGASSI